MSYDKLSLASFKEGLKADKYASATGARRAVGKASTLTDADKDKARTIIDAHFGTSATPAPKKAAAKKAAASAKTPGLGRPKKAAASAKPAPKKAQSKKAGAQAKKATAAAKPAQRAPRVMREEHVGEAIAHHGGIDLDNTNSVSTQMRIAEKTIQNAGAAMSVLAQTKQQYPDVDLSSAVEEMGGTLAGAVSIFRNIVNEISNQGITKTAAKKAAVAKAAPITTPAPQGVVNSGAGLFKDSSPDGNEAQASG